MTVAAIMMVRDEADIIEHTLRHTAGQVDLVLVADNLSVDGTRSILELVADELGDIIILDDEDPRFLQSAKMSLLAVAAAMNGADWIVPVDADEIWTAPDGTVAELLEGQTSDTQAVNGSMFDHVATGLDDLDDPNPVTRMRWRRLDRHSMPKVACRWAENLTIQPGNHAARYGREPTRKNRRQSLDVRHFRYRSPEQTVTKIRNGYHSHKISGVPETTGAHYFKLGRLMDAHGEQALVDEFHREYFMDLPEVTMIEDPAPFLPKVAV